MANRTARNESRRVRLDKGEKKKIERKKENEERTERVQ